MIVDLNELSGDDSRVIEIWRRISIRPQPLFTCVLEHFVLDLIQLFTVKIARKLLALRRHTKRNPLPGRSFHFFPFVRHSLLSGMGREKLFGSFAGDRQFDEEPASSTFDAFHSDLTAVSSDDRFDN